MSLQSESVSTSRETLTAREKCCQRGGCQGVWGFLALLGVAGCGALHLANWWPETLTWGVFEATEDATWRTFQTAGGEDILLYHGAWFFWIWLAVYAIQIVWIMAALSLLCGSRHSKTLARSATPSQVYVLTLLGVPAGVLGWLQLWTRDAMSLYAPLCLLWSLALQYAALAVSLGSLRKVLYAAYELRAQRVLWTIRLVVHNGLSLLVTWLTFVLFYTVVALLCRGGLVDDRISRYLFLGLIGAYTLLYFILDVAVAWKYTGHVMAPYPVAALTLVQVLLKLLPYMDDQFILAACLLGATVVCFIVKVILAAKRSPLKL